MNTNSNTEHIPLDFKSQKKIVENILKAICDCSFAYNEEKKQINYEIAILGLNSSSRDDILTIISNFSNLSQFQYEIGKEKMMADLLFNCESSIEQLKHISPNGNVMYEIITSYCLKKKYKTVALTAEALNISTRTFYRYKNDAYKQLYRIWFVLLPKNILKYAKIINAQLNSEYSNKNDENG